MLSLERMEIVDFRPDLAAAFKALNEAWITTLFALEPKDERCWATRRARSSRRGGRILFAVDGGEAVGCCALMALPDGGFEVAKMAVADTHKGRGLGRALMAACVERARAAGAPRLYLETNCGLAPALASTAASGSSRSSRPSLRPMRGRTYDGAGAQVTSCGCGSDASAPAAELLAR